MERFVGRVALVTGASTGIGAAVALSLANLGMKVVGCSRSLEKLSKVSEAIPESCTGSFTALQCDMGKEDEISGMFDTIKKDFGGVDVLINNAGHATNAPLLSGSTQDWRDMLNVNVLGVAIATRETVQSMKDRNVDDGHIINVCSMSGHRITRSPATHFYGATKHTMRAMTEGVRNELRAMKSNIRISEVSPGVVETEFFVKLNGQQSANKLYKSMNCLQSQDLADTIVHIISAPPHVQIHDVLMRSTEQVM